MPFFRRGSRCRGPRLFFARIIALAPLLAPVAPAQENLPPPAAPAQTIKPFQPGVRIDWQAPAVHVDARVVLREGPLEFFACFSGKEHESILRFNAEAEAVYMALGLIGLLPGAPHTITPTGDYRPPRGALIDIEVEWTSSGPDGAAPAEKRRARANDWLREIEFDRPPPPRPWVFVGSMRLPNGVLLAGVDGFGVGLVSHRENLLSLSAPHSVSDAALWLVAATERIPPDDTPVTVIFRPARWNAPAIQLRANGTLEIEGRFATVEDLIDVLRINALAGIRGPQVIKCEPGVLKADRRRVARIVGKTELGAGAISVEEIPPGAARD